MMKRLISFSFMLVLLLTLAACNKEEDNGKNKESNAVALDEVLTALKEEMATHLEDVGMPDAFKEDGSLDGYIQSDLVHPSEDDQQSAMFLERLGIKSDDLEAGFVIAAMMNINSDEIILLQAKDDSKVEELEAALKKELEAQTSTWEQYLPDQYEKVKNNIIKTKGNYLIYITYEDPEALEAVFDEKLK